MTPYFAGFQVHFQEIRPLFITKTSTMWPLKETLIFAFQVHVHTFTKTLYFHDFKYTNKKLVPLRNVLLANIVVHENKP